MADEVADKVRHVISSLLWLMATPLDGCARRHAHHGVVMEFAPDKARWPQVAEVIQRRIEDGTYPPRSRVPSVVQLIAEFGIAHATAHTVLTGLRAKGLTYTEPGLGSFVSPASRSEGLAESEDTQPAWRQVAAAITARITDGSYPVAMRVPSTLELAAEFEIATSTAQKVLAHLKNEGLVRAEVGLGAFVAERPERPESLGSSQ